MSAPEAVSPPSRFLSPLRGLLAVALLVVLAGPAAALPIRYAIDAHSLSLDVRAFGIGHEVERNAGFLVVDTDEVGGFLSKASVLEFELGVGGSLFRHGDVQAGPNAVFVKDHLAYLELKAENDEGDSLLVAFNGFKVRGDDGKTSGFLSFRKAPGAVAGPVPEPGAALAFGVGALTLTLAHRRGRRRA